MIQMIVFIIVLVVGFGVIAKNIIKLDNEAQGAKSALEAKTVEVRELRDDYLSEKKKRAEAEARAVITKPEEDKMPKAKMKVRDVVVAVLKLETKKGKGKEINVADGMEFMKCLREVLIKKKGIDIYKDVIHA